MESGGPHDERNQGNPPDLMRRDPPRVGMMLEQQESGSGRTKIGRGCDKNAAEIICDGKNKIGELSSDMSYRSVPIPRGHRLGPRDQRAQTRPVNAYECDFGVSQRGAVVPDADSTDRAK